ncbi:MAG: alginate export family protein [Candidatus Latescibacteria bacterium]|nr:alginate export family protein [Candidatus Latescibacterota bacterium]
MAISVFSYYFFLKGDMMKNRMWALIAMFIFTSGFVSAKEITIGGQIRPRSEFRDPVSIGHDMFTSMRVRAQIAAKLDKNVDAFIQLQDVRLWGEEANTLGDYNANNFDLHQGYITLNNINDAPFSIRAGRQAIAFGGQRLIGSVEWTQQGRVFDGLRMMLKPQWGKVDVLAIRLFDATAAGINTNAYLTGIYATTSSGIDFYGIYNRASGSTDQYTVGARWASTMGARPVRLEGSFQTGERGGSDVSAFMFGGRLGLPLGKAKLTLWYDYLSGDDNATDGKTKVFDTLFATNHKFYGFADLFLNIPAHTKGLGLQDVAIKFAVPLNNGVKLGIDGHAFFLSKQGTASGKHLGEEIDVTLSYKYSTEVTFVGGASYVIAKQPLTDIGRLGDDMKFAYFMTNVAF